MKQAYICIQNHVKRVQRNSKSSNILKKREIVRKFISFPNTQVFYIIHQKK